MSLEAGRDKGRVFTIELKSGRALTHASLADDPNGGILIEGNLGSLVNATFSDGVVLEIVGSEGTLRVDLLASEITRTGALSKQAATAP